MENSKQILEAINVIRKAHEREILALKEEMKKLQQEMQKLQIEVQKSQQITSETQEILKKLIGNY